MAVAGREASLTRSILQGSESSDEDMPDCLPCERGGRSVEAGGFCRTCNEHLCQSCYNSHLLPKPLANHVLLDKSMMPRVAPSPDNMCTEHPTEQLEYYCKNHDKLECSKCVHIHHRTCEDVRFIQDICDDIEDSEEFKTLYGTLTSIGNDVEENKTKATTNLTYLQDTIEEIKTNIHIYRKYLDDQLDKMEEATCEEVEILSKSDKETIENVSNKCDALTFNVRSVMSNLDTSRKTQHKLRMFITMKNTGRIISGWQNQLDDIISKNIIRQYEFKPEKQLHRAVGEGQTLGHLVGDDGDITQSPDSVITEDEVCAQQVLERRDSDVQLSDPSPPKGTGASNARQQSTLQHMTAIREDRINIKSGSDGSHCYITGSVFTCENHLAVADNKNKSIKIADLDKKKVIDCLSLKHRPWDITRIDKHTLAVTCPDGGYIQLVRMSKSKNLTMDRQIKIGKGCRGIRYIGCSGLVVSFTNPHKVEIMDMSGTILKDVSLDSAGGVRFNSPNHITMCNDGSTLLVSDQGKYRVSGLTLNGVLKFVYSDTGLTETVYSGVAVGDGGEIYLCDCGSNRIHVIPRESRKIKILLEKSDGLKHPESITFSDNKLFVGSQHNNYVDVYRIEYMYI